MEICDLLLNGFMIYRNGDKFIVRKEAVPDNLLIITEQKYENYDLALIAAVDLLKKKQVFEWEVIVRYNRGLGIEYKNISNVMATDKEKALFLAEINAKKFFEESTEINEIKVRIKK